MVKIFFVFNIPPPTPSEKFFLSIDHTVDMRSSESIVSVHLYGDELSFSHLKSWSEQSIILSGLMYLAILGGFVCQLDISYIRGKSLS